MSQTAPIGDDSCEETSRREQLGETSHVLSGLMIVVLLLLLPPVPEATWEWPTEGTHRVVRDFRAPTSPWGPGHRGLDLAAKGPICLPPPMPP